MKTCFDSDEVFLLFGAESILKELKNSESITLDMDEEEVLENLITYSHLILRKAKVNRGE